MPNKEPSFRQAEETPAFLLHLEQLEGAEVTTREQALCGPSPEMTSCQGNLCAMDCEVLPKSFWGCGSVHQNKQAVKFEAGLKLADLARERLGSFNVPFFSCHLL